MNRTIVSGQSGGREDLQTQTEMREVFVSNTEDTNRSLKTLTVFSSAGFWARVNPSRIFPRYDPSLLFSVKTSRKDHFSSISSSLTKYKKDVCVQDDKS